MLGGTALLMLPINSPGKATLAICSPSKLSLAVGAKPARRLIWKIRFDPHFAAVLAHKTEGETGGRARRPASVLLGRRKSIGAPRGTVLHRKKVGAKTALLRHGGATRI